MAKAKPRNKKDVSTREQILVVAEDLIARHGMDGFQLKDVAEQVGIRPPSIFAHFRGRDGVAQAVAERFSEGFASRVTLQEGEDPAATIRRWVRDVVRYYIDNPAHIRLTFRDLAMVGSPNIWQFESTMPLMREIAGKIEDVIQRGVRDGVFHPVRTEAFIAQTIGGIVANLAWNGWDEHGRPKLDGPASRYEAEAENLALALLAKRP